MRSCGYAAEHVKRRVVLTGGPGVGKTTVLELVLEAWRAQPRRFVVEAKPEFPDKAGQVLDVLRAERSDCCRNPARARPDSHDGAQA
jgi:Ni2+-binding GTPase involved in maturation of urease and hydrogenase